MRTYLTRLTMAAAAAMLTGVSLAGVAHADDDDGIYHLDPSVLEDVGNLEPCDELSASEDMLFPVDPNWEPGDILPPTEPEDPETPLVPDGIELVPCYQIPVDPEDAGNGGGGNGNGGNGNGGGNGGGGNGNGGGNGGQSGGGQPGGGSNGQPSGEPSGDPSDGGGDEGFDETAEDQASQPQETVTPTAATGTDGNGNLMLAVLAGVLGTAGLLILIYGLRKRPRRGQQLA